MRFSSPVLRGGYRIGTMTLALFTFLTVLVPCSSGQLSIVFPIQITTKLLRSRPSFTGWLSNGADRVYIAVLIGFSSPVLRGGYRILSYQQLKKQTKVLVPSFTGWWLSIDDKRQRYWR